MIRNLRSVMALTACGVLAAVVASANVPVPELSTVPRCFQLHPSVALANAVPANAAKYNVTILGIGGPISAASVELRMITPGDTLVCWCNTPAGPRPYVFQMSTNPSGVARFVIGGGGCIQYGLAAIPGSRDFAGEVFADGIRMQEFGTVSSDAVDSSGRRPTDTMPGWEPGLICAAGLADAVEHTNPLATNTYDYCTDFNCDNQSGASDAVIVTPFLAGAASCAGNAGP